MNYIISESQVSLKTFNSESAASFWKLFPCQRMKRTIESSPLSTFNLSRGVIKFNVLLTSLSVFIKDWSKVT